MITVKFIKAICGMIFFLYTSVSAAYDNIEFLWISSTQLQATSPAVTVTDYNSSGGFKFSFPGNINGVLAGVSCLSSSLGSFTNVNRVLYFSYPATATTPEGLTFNLSAPTGVSGSGMGGAGAPATNFAAYVSTNNTNGPSINCQKINSVSNGPVAIPSASITIPYSVVRNKAIPGRYQGGINMVFAVYENYCKTCLNSGVLGSTWYTAVQDVSLIKLNYDITVSSLCSYNADPINLSHGIVNLTTGVSSYPSGNYSLNITCNTSNPSVSLKLTGSNPVASMTANYTQCGSGGSCELVFDVGSSTNQYNKTLNISGTQAINIRSIYHPNASNLAGSFSGSGVLTILVN
ncbi:MAG: hypothetical protein WAU54_18605 [Chania sp.]